MLALRVEELTGPGALRLVEAPEPEAGPDAVVVDVTHAGVAWPDLLMTRGLYQVKPPLPFSPGGEAAGVVRTAPAGSGLAAGDRVAVLTGAGAWQSVLAVGADSVFALPAAVSPEAGAGLLFNHLTVHFGLRLRAGLREGETVLVHGASGGIGVATLDLCRAFGARSIAVVSSEEKAAVARAYGASEVVLADGFLGAVKELTGGRGVDVVVDPVGGDRFTDSLRSLGPGGRLLVIGFTGGEIPTVKVNRLLLNNVSVVGVGWGAWFLTHPGYLQEQWAELRPLLESGAARAPEVVVHPASAAAQVLEDMEARRLTGKAVLRF